MEVSDLLTMKYYIVNIINGISKMGMLALDENDNILLEQSGTGPVFNCIPDLSTYVPEEQQGLVQVIKCCQPTGNQIYASIYAALQGFDLVTSGVGGSIQSNLESWFGRFAIIVMLPWVIILTALFIYFMVTKVMSFAAGMIFISVTFILAIIAIAWIFWDAYDTSLNVYNNTIATISDNWNKYKYDIGGQIIDGYLLDENTMCNKYEDLACCNFDYTSCINGCGVAFTITPNIIPTNSTGTLNIDIEPDTGKIITGGTVFIPPEINGGTATTIPLNNDGSYSGIFNYRSTNTPGVVDVVAQFISADGNFSSGSQVTLVGSGGNLTSNRRIGCRSCKK